jgi:hypothetical protein
MNNSMDFNSERFIIYVAANTTNEASYNSLSLSDVRCEIYILLTKAT